MITKYKKKFKSLDELMKNKKYITDTLKLFCNKFKQYKYKTNVSVSNQKYILTASVRKVNNEL